MIFWVGGKNCIQKNEKCIIYPKSRYVTLNPDIFLRFYLILGGPKPILEFKGSTWHVQKGHPALVTQVDLILQN